MDFAENNTNYAYKLKYMDTASFDEVRKLSANFCQELPQSLVDELYETLNRGVDLLDSEPQMAAYMYSFGRMHQAKLEFAFGKLPKDFLLQDEVDIVDWGCGQALATMCYADFLRQNGYPQKVRTITLVEPSELCMKRAALHASVFFPDAQIKVVNKFFDDLSDWDINTDSDMPVLHLFSNVLDIQTFSLDGLAEIVSGCINSYAQFVCVGPYFGHSGKDGRMEEFAELLDGTTSFAKSFESGEFEHGKSWTAQIRCFSVGMLEENFSTEVTEEDLKNGVADEFGVVYSRDGKRLLKCKNSKLETYTIKEGTKVVCDDAFYYYSSLQSLTLPDSVTSIGDRAFWGCESLQSLTLPDSLTSIGSNPFCGCCNLKLQSKSSRFVVAEDFLIDRVSNTIISYLGKAECVVFPASVTSVGNSAFEGCESLQSLTLPDSLTSIGNSVFEGCSSLQSLTLPASLASIGDRAFWGCSSLQSLTLPDSLTSIGSNPFILCSNLKLQSKSSRFVVAEDLLIDRVSNTIISYLGKAECVVLPASVTSIGDFAFSDCSSLHSLTLLDSVTSIGDCAFSDCESLQSLTLPASLTSIGDSAFGGCSSLHSLTLPDSLTSIGDFAFSDCSSLHSLTLPASLTSIGDCAFSCCKSLQSLTLPASLTSIGDDAFYRCESLQSLTLPDSLASIGDRSFWGCKSLQSLTLPDSLTSIGDDAFYRCESLRYIIIPENSVEKFKEMLPNELWEKLYYLKKVVEDDDSLF